ASDRDDRDVAQDLDQRSEPQWTNREIPAATRSEALNERASLPKSFPSAATEEESQKAPDSARGRQSAVEPRKSPDEFSRPTAYAGLFFLIPLLSKLGLPGALEANQNLIEFNLAERLLSFVGASLGIPDGDPAISFLTPAAP